MHFTYKVLIKQLPPPPTINRPFRFLSINRFQVGQALNDPALHGVADSIGFKGNQKNCFKINKVLFRHFVRKRECHRICNLGRVVVNEKTHNIANEDTGVDAVGD